MQRYTNPLRLTLTALLFTLLLGARPAEAQSPHALRFDGVDDLVTLGDTLDLMTQDHTMEFWMRTEAGETRFGSALAKHIWQSSSGFNLAFNHSACGGQGKMCWYTGGANLSSSTPFAVSDGEWHHVAAVYDVTNGEKRIYVDGQLDGTSTALGGGGNLDADFLVGGYFSSGNLDSFPGDLDEVRIWGVARTEAEIQADMDTPLDGDESGLLAYYRIDEGTGTVLTDAAGDIHGTFVSDPTWIAPGAPITYPPPPPVCEQSLSASLIDYTPPPGGAATFAVTVANASPDPAALDLWLDVTGPVSRVIRLGSGTVPGGDTVTRNVRVRVPGNAPQGTYTLDLHLGTFPGDVCDTASLELTVGPGTRAAGTGSADFEVLDDFFAAPPSASALTTGLSVSPNPFAGRATIQYAVAEAGAVRVSVYDLLGREVAVLADGATEAGTHGVAFDASALASGVYVVRLVADGVVHTQRLTLAR